MPVCSTPPFPSAKRNLPRTRASIVTRDIGWVAVAKSHLPAIRGSSHASNTRAGEAAMLLVTRTVASRPARRAAGAPSCASARRRAGINTSSPMRARSSLVRGGRLPQSHHAALGIREKGERAHPRHLLLLDVDLAARVHDFLPVGREVVDCDVEEHV